jgi:hypothetical protein
LSVPKLLLGALLVCVLATITGIANPGSADAAKAKSCNRLNAPNGLVTTGKTDTTVSLDWTSGACGSRDYYTVYTYASNGTTLVKSERTTSDPSQPNTSAWVVKSLTAGTTYVFRVTVSKGTTESPKSSPVTVSTNGAPTPPPPPPPPPAVQCADGVDNDADSLVDYPADPGCASATDNDETNAGGINPKGPPGTWTLKFQDEFSGTSLDTTKWTNTWFNGGAMNKVSTVASNVSVANGVATLTLSDSTHGALIHTTQGTGRYSLPVGGVVEARILFPGNGTSVYNWAAFWANDTSTYPAGGEHDIAEVLGGRMTVNYHSPAGAFNQGAPSGYWGGAFHTYTLHRKASSADVYWDGVLVKSYATSDNGRSEDIILNVGASSLTQTGAAGAIKVDYVRAWQ